MILTKFSLTYIYKYHRACEITGYVYRGQIRSPSHTNHIKIHRIAEYGESGTWLPLYAGNKVGTNNFTGWVLILTREYAMHLCMVER